MTLNSFRSLKLLSAVMIVPSASSAKARTWQSTKENLSLYLHLKKAARLYIFFSCLKLEVLQLNSTNAKCLL